MLPNSTDAPLTTEALFRAHGPFVARFLRRIGVPQDHVEDALQEVFLAVHRNGGYKPGLAKPTSYLARLCIYAAANRRRRGQAEAARASSWDVDDLVFEGQDPAQRLQARQDATRLQHALERLPEELSTTLLLVDLEGESCVSLAAAFGLPVGTVYWRLHEARKRLKVALAAVEASHKRERRAAAQVSTPATGQRTSALGAVMVFGTSSFERSEAGRLLRRVREQRGPQPSVDAWLSVHRELIRSGAEMPSWVASSAPLTPSLVSLVGPVVGGLAAGGAALAVVAGLVLSGPPVDDANGALPSGSQAPAVGAHPVSTLNESATSGGVVQERPRAEPVSSPASVVVPKVAAAEPTEAPAHLEAAHASVETTRPDSPSSPTAEAPAPRPRSASSVQRPALTPPSEIEARSASPAAPTLQPAPAAGDDRALLELREVAQAEQLLSTDPQRALTLAQRAAQRFPAGYFAEERDYVQAMALLKLGRTKSGARRARAFLVTYPRSPYRGPLQRALSGVESDR